MSKALLGLLVVFLVAAGTAVAFPGEWGSPPAPQPVVQNAAAAHYDFQVHSRDSATAMSPMAAQHGSACQGPPATHNVSAFVDTVFVCNDHVMTAANSGDGYAMIAITPSQVVNCANGCSVQWEMSTERQSLRDWPDVWLTPWLDNLTLPLSAHYPDLNGPPRVGIHVTADASQNSWSVMTINNGSESSLNGPGVSMSAGIAGGTNQAAVRQAFKLTLSTGPTRVRMERLASATASAHVWFDGPCSCLLASDYVVQFAHHSYNPTKDGAGVPATWHWGNFVLQPAAPFNLIKSPTTLLTTAGTVFFDAPAPANAYLRFTGLCRVSVDGVLAPKQRFTGSLAAAASYFVPIAQGKQSVNISFSADGWYGPGFGCRAQGFAIWSQTGGAPSPTPTSTIPAPTSTATPVATSTSTPVNTPTPTATSTPTTVPSTPTPTVVPPTSTPTPSPDRCYNLLTRVNGVTGAQTNYLGQEVPC